MLAVTAQVGGAPRDGLVDVYSADGGASGGGQRPRRFVADACVTGWKSPLAVVLMGQEDRAFLSAMWSFYDLTRPGEAAVTADYVVSDGLVTAMGCQGSSILTVTDTCLPGGCQRKRCWGPIPRGEYLREYDLGGDDFTALLLNRYQSGSVGRLVTVDDKGEEIASLDISEEVGSVCQRAVSLRAV